MELNIQTQKPNGKGNGHLLINEKEPTREGRLSQQHKS